jgi:hypothetical protein
MNETKKNQFVSSPHVARTVAGEKAPPSHVSSEGGEQGRGGGQRKGGYTPPTHVSSEGGVWWGKTCFDVLIWW